MESENVKGRFLTVACPITECAKNSRVLGQFALIEPGTLGFTFISFCTTRNAGNRESTDMPMY